MKTEWMLVLALVLGSGCVRDGAIARFDEFENRYLNHHTVWALDEKESQSYDGALAALKAEHSGDPTLSRLIDWRRTTLEANRALHESARLRALVNPMDEDCRESGRLKRARAESEQAVRLLNEAKAGAAALSGEKAESVIPLAQEEKTIGFLAGSEQSELDALKKMEQYACEKRFS